MTDSVDAYTLKQVQQMLGISPVHARHLVHAGFVTPTRGAHNAWLFSFQDLMLLRSAHTLRRANIPARRITVALRKLKAQLPAHLPIGGLRIAAVGADVVVREADTTWNPATGQLLMDFEVVPRGGGVAFLTPAPAADAPPPDEARGWFERGNALEATKPREAEQAFRRALTLAPDFVDACLNLGALLCEQGRFKEAAALYVEAMPRCAPSALMHFNLAVAREGEGAPAAALAEYEAALAIDPTLADAHFNLARILEQLGNHRSAVRHLSAYRRLQR
ncbi:tetratricopeptide repeat protein [Niveibacterium sp. SC-1]|uniref:tetratricopeptide repeat protein n=1 Tax=Niveibacterium sp. SC-1 TaxID=3135646 RepID=UPI00311DC905